MKIEKWNGHDIRFIEHMGEWWAVGKDVAEVLGYSNPRDALRVHVYDSDKNTVVIYDGNKGNPNQIIISELGIYNLVFKSKLPAAVDFQRWVYSLLKTIRQSENLETYEMFRLLDKQHQKQAMDFLQKNLSKPSKKDYIKANTIANKAVSIAHGYEKMKPKSQMSEAELKEREVYLTDAVELMAVKEKYKLDVSISDKVYQVATGKEAKAN